MSAVAQARERRQRKAQIVRDAAQTPQGRALLDLISEEFGAPAIGGDNQFRAMANFGQSEVVVWLKRAEEYRGEQDE